MFCQFGQVLDTVCKSNYCGAGGGFTYVTRNVSLQLRSDVLFLVTSAPQRFTDLFMKEAVYV